MTRISRILFVGCALLSGGTARGDDAPVVPDALIEVALVEAGANRPELEKAIAEIAKAGDPKRLAAVRFLVANMPGKGYVITAWKDAKGNKVAFDPLVYPDFAAAEKAYDALEKEHGKIDFVQDRLVKDVETMKADFLVRHVNAAFRAWESSPEAWRVSFDAFLQYVLPYRGSEEPIDDWLSPLAERYKALPSTLGASPDAKALWGWLGKDVGDRVHFNERYYLHPTDQGFTEMGKSGQGRCEDITNMTTYAARSRGLATAADYTPAWGHRDNNHAWNVLLDQDGRGSEPSNAHAAKVYRKTFAIQRGNLAFQLPAGREAPNRFLASKSYVDVTDQYGPTTDVTVELDAAAARDEKFAFLCVFNGGEWIAIDWARIEHGKATFSKMGRGSAGMLYLPAIHDGKALVPAGAPRVLGKDGKIETLSGSGGGTELVATAVSPEQVSVDTKVVTPVSRLKTGATYLLFQWWNTGWAKISEAVATSEPLVFKAVPAGELYWLVEKDSKKLERPFTIVEGRQRFR